MTMDEQHEAMATAYDYMTETAAQIRRGLKAILDGDLVRAESILEHIKEDVDAALHKVREERTAREGQG